jgi:hypothetical protein
MFHHRYNIFTEYFPVVGEQRGGKEKNSVLRKPPNNTVQGELRKESETE